MRIYLIGYMGCGKSTLGKKLAQKLELQFVDMDRYIEKRHCQSVAQIFKKWGEKGFREKEQKSLQELSDFTNIVIATGGGAPTFFDNIDTMNQTGITIFINITTEELVTRLLRSRVERPLIKGKSKEELIAFIDKNLSQRLPFYNQAQINYFPDTESVDDLVGKIRRHK